MLQLNEMADVARAVTLDELERASRRIGLVGFGKDAGQRLDTEVENRRELRVPACSALIDGMIKLAHRFRVSSSSARSASTMSLTRSLNVVVGFQPSRSRALLASPMSRSTSVGRRYFLSTTTYFV